jgi:aryl-alcohol dehydrogenase-like predicted oxidoreductase
MKAWVMPVHTLTPALGHPDHISEECNRSLARLGTDSIELYQVHVPDPNYPYAGSCIGPLHYCRSQEPHA